jgi:hypothetical protein
MGRIAGFTFVILVGCGVAFGASGGKQLGKDTSWDAVETLPVDALVRVLPEHQGGPDVCRVASIDERALTCVRENGGDVRLVFPRDAVREVWVLGRARDRHVVKWVFVGIGVGLGTALIVANPLVGGAIVGSVLVGIESSQSGHGMQSPPPRPPRLRWAVVYQAPVAGISPAKDGLSP